MDPLFVVLLVVGAAVYLAACRISPFTGCLRCSGTGKHRSTGAPFLVVAAVLVLVSAQTDAPSVFVVAVVVAIAGVLIRGGSWRSCRRCKGTGTRRRAGRTLMNATASTTRRSR